MKNADMPAMPGLHSINRDTGEIIPHQSGSNDFSSPGLTKREHFAGLAMQALASGGLDPAMAASRATEFADALLAELEGES